MAFFHIIYGETSRNGIFFSYYFMKNAVSVFFLWITRRQMLKWHFPYHFMKKASNRHFLWKKNAEMTIFFILIFEKNYPYHLNTFRGFLKYYWLKTFLINLIDLFYFSDSLNLIDWYATRFILLAGALLV